jgi:HAD superfamily hydrolase (TIGR01509 family)
MPPVDAVVFDVGRVIVEWDLRVLIRKLIPDEAEVEHVYRNVVSPDWHFRHDAGVPLAEMIPARIAEFPQYEAVILAYAARFTETIPGAVPGTIDLVEALDAGGVPLYAITNFGAEFWPAFRAEWPVIERFRDVVVSGVERIAKPDPEIYRLAAQRFGHDPERMLFIDDNRDNVEAARALGWQAHHFADAETLASDLRARGLIG